MALIILLFWLVLNPVMSATLDELGDSYTARWTDLDITQLEVATVSCALVLHVKFRSIGIPNPGLDPGI